jgi:hypothetical protein
MLFLTLLACGTPESFVVSGTYTPVRASADGNAYEASELSGVTLVVDVDAATATLTFSTPATTSLEERDHEDWLQGCPTNVSSVHEQTFSTDWTQVILGPVTIDAPVLAATCDGEGVQLQSTSDPFANIQFEPG